MAQLICHAVCLVLSTAVFLYHLCCKGHWITSHLYLQLPSPRHGANIHMKYPGCTSNEPSTMTSHAPVCVTNPGPQELGVNQGKAAAYCFFHSRPPSRRHKRYSTPAAASATSAMQEFSVLREQRKWILPFPTWLPSAFSQTSFFLAVLPTDYPLFHSELLKRTASVNLAKAKT